MGRLVDVDELKHELKWLEEYDPPVYHDVMSTIDEIATVDAEPVKHGEWRYDEALELEWCSECGFGKRKGDKRWYSYCPNCGAYMGVEDVRESD